MLSRIWVNTVGMIYFSEAALTQFIAKFKVWTSLRFNEV